jgi:4a-hydroxytetrahydrobiopterin dehydratase
MSKPMEKIYTEPEIDAKLRELGLTDWYLEDGWLRRKLNTDGWPTTLTNAIGYLCEAAYTPTCRSPGASCGSS